MPKRSAPTEEMARDASCPSSEKKQKTTATTTTTNTTINNDEWEPAVGDDCDVRVAGVWQTIQTGIRFSSSNVHQYDIHIESINNNNHSFTVSCCNATYNAGTWAYPKAVVFTNKERDEVRPSTGLTPEFRIKQDQSRRAAQEAEQHKKLEREQKQRERKEAEEKRLAEKKALEARYLNTDQTSPENCTSFPFGQENHSWLLTSSISFVNSPTTGVFEKDKQPMWSNDELDPENVKALHAQTQKLTIHMNSWKPSHCEEEWESWFVLPQTIKLRGGSEAIEAGAVVDAFKAMYSVQSEVEEKKRNFRLETQQLTNTRKTFWPKRFYFNNNRLDKKILTKIKAASNQIKSACVKNSVVVFKGHNTHTEYWDSGIIIAGWSKKVANALFCVRYYDFDEEHVYYGR